MRITADTNVLLRAVVDDHPRESPIAQAAMRDAEAVALSLPMLCEFVWVLRQGYKWTGLEIAELLREFLETPSLVMERHAVAAGLAMVKAGGDFADGVIAFEGLRLGGTVLVTFDRRAASLLGRSDIRVELLEA